MLISALTVVGAGFGAVVAVLFALDSQPTPAVVSAVLAGVMLAVGIALRRGSRIARWVVVVSSTIGFVQAILLLPDQLTTNLVIGPLVVWALTLRPEVSAFFRRPTAR